MEDKFVQSTPKFRSR